MRRNTSARNSSASMATARKSARPIFAASVGSTLILWVQLGATGGLPPVWLAVAKHGRTSRPWHPSIRHGTPKNEVDPTLGSRQLDTLFVHGYHPAAFDPSFPERDRDARCRCSAHQSV